MTTNGDTKDHLQAVIGNDKNFWLYDSKTGFNLTHPPKPDSPAISPSATIETKTSPVTIDPAKSALVIVDMQNYFLSEALGRAKGNGHKALDQLVQHAIPACRKAGIRIIWLNWGLSQQEIDDMNPAVIRAFGFIARSENGTVPLDKYGSPQFTGGDKIFEDGKDGRKYRGLGSDMGRVTDPESGKEIEAGRMLMRDQWNSALYPPLNKMYDEGKKLETRPDVWIHKNRMSGMWGPKTACEEFLEKERIRTLFFTGVNTDQCVGGTYQDCFSKGYDCILLGDGCGTTSPGFAQDMVEFNAANTWGFVTKCRALAEGVKGMR
jgi:nicotinamidase-related amidase